MTTHQAAWTHLEEVSNKWFHKPDLLALRAVLGTIKALDLPTTSVWLMLIGPSSSGKTDFFIQCATCYPKHELSDDISIPGLISGAEGKKGMGVLQRLNPRGLWLMADFTVLLNTREEKRNEILGAQRKIFEGKYDRDANGEKVSWRGHINAIAACTPAIEKFTRVVADMGERWIQCRITKPRMCDDLVRKLSLQRRFHDQFHDEICAAAKDFLKPGVPADPSLPFEYERLIARWGDFAAMCRTTVDRDFKDDIKALNDEEGAGRVTQQMMGLACADAALFGQPTVLPTQLDLIKRVAYDSIPKHRRAILLAMPVNEAITKSDLEEMSGITHPYTFAKALEELQAFHILKAEVNHNPKIWFSERSRSLLNATETLESKDVHLIPE